MDYTERNELIADMYESGMTYRKIAKKMGLSTARVHSINVHRYERMKLEKDALYKALNEAAKATGMSKRGVTRVYKRLKGLGVEKVADLDGFTEEELMNVRGFGTACLETVKKARETACGI